VPPTKVSRHLFSADDVTPNVDIEGASNVQSTRLRQVNAPVLAVASVAMQGQWALADVGTVCPGEGGWSLRRTDSQWSGLWSGQTVNTRSPLNGRRQEGTYFEKVRAAFSGRLDA
jgi:hypothetical protein